MSKLKSNFKTSDFYQKQDGSTRLNGQAEAFVSGWYGDIAYNRGFLAVNSDSTAKLTDEEYAKTKNGFIGTGTDTFLVDSQAKELQLESSNEVITKNYISPLEEGTTKGTVRYNDNYKATSLQDELNTTVRIDKDMNGEITLPEAYQANLANSNKDARQVVINHDEEYYHVVINTVTGQVKDDALHSGFNEIVGNVLTGTKKHKHDKKKHNKNSVETETDSANSTQEDNSVTSAQQAMQKLIASNGDSSVLGVDERSAIQTTINSAKQNVSNTLKNSNLLDVIA